MSESNCRKKVWMSQCKKWNTARKCTRSYTLCYCYKWSPWCINEYSTNIYWWYKYIYRTVNDNRDKILLQQHLNKLHQWSVKWQLIFNAKKCKVMHLGSKNSKAEYMMDGTTLESVNRRKGPVLIDNELKFHKHVSQAISKAIQTLSIVKMTFDTLDKELLAIVYKHQVRPHLQHGNDIWHPCYIADMKTSWRSAKQSY